MGIKRIFFLLLTTVTFIEACSQDKLEDWETSSTWCEGKVIDNDGKELKGQVKYNDLDGLVLLRDEQQKRTFNARNILGFSFKDASNEHIRTFYSLEYEDQLSNVKRPLFFEVVKEFKRFSILIKKDPVVYNQQSGGAPGSNNSMRDANGVVRAQQTETIYFLNQNGTIEPYLELEIQQTNGLFRERVKNKKKVIDDDLPRKYFGEKNYAKLLSYAKENDLKINRKDDFLKIVEYYRQIIGE